MNKHNSLGFRGEEFEIEKPEGAFRIACLGGSTTYGVLEDFRESFPYSLQQVLHERGYTRVEVINAAAEHYSSWESFICLQFRLLELDPDMIYLYHAINDINARLVWPPSAYQADNSAARIANATSLKMAPIWHYSTLARFFLIRFGYVQPYSSLSVNLIERPPTFYADLHTMQYHTKRYPKGIFEEVPAYQMIEENPPKYFESNLRGIIAVAKANNIDVLFSTFAYSPLFEQFPRVSTKEYQKGFKEHNEIIRSFADEVSLFDFAEIMPVDKKYYRDGRHFTALGNRHRAKLVADYLIDNDLIKQ